MSVECPDFRAVISTSALEASFTDRFEQRRAVVPEDLIAAERLRKIGVDRLLAAAKELQADPKALVRVDRVAHRHDVDAAVTLAIVDEPANDRQPIGCGVPHRPLRQRRRAEARAKARLGRPRWRGETLMRRRL